MTKLNKISGSLDLTGTDGRYLVCEYGPDDHSTFEECWGNNAKFAYRAIDATDSLPTARSLVSRRGIIMDTHSGRTVPRR